MLRCALPATGDADLFHACSGMNAIYTTFRAVTELQAARDRTIWVQLGWLYRDTISLLKRFTPDPACDYVHLYGVSDQAALERLFAEHGGRIAGIFAETPTNPLIQTPDVPALAGLARRHGARLILDPSIASLFCVDVLAYAHVRVHQDVNDPRAHRLKVFPPGAGGGTTPLPPTPGTVPYAVLPPTPGPTPPRFAGPSRKSWSRSIRATWRGSRRKSAATKTSWRDSMPRRSGSSRSLRRIAK